MRVETGKSLFNFTVCITPTVEVCGAHTRAHTRGAGASRAASRPLDGREGGAPPWLHLIPEKRRRAQSYFNQALPLQREVLQTGIENLGFESLVLG